MEEDNESENEKTDDDLEKILLFEGILWISRYAKVGIQSTDEKRRDEEAEYSDK